MCPGLYGGGALGVDVADHRPLGFQHSGPGLIGDIGGHALVRHQPGRLAHQHAHHLGARHVPDHIPGPYPAVPDEDGLAAFDVPQLQPLLDGRQTVGGIGQDRRRGQAVADDQLHLGILRQGFLENCQIFCIEDPAQVRPGQVLVLALAAGLHGHEAVAGPIVLRNLAEYRVLGRRMVRPEAEHGQGFVPGTGPAAAQTGGGLGLHGEKPRPVCRIFRQVEPAQVQLGDVRHKAIRLCRVLLGGLRGCGVIGRGLHRRLWGHGFQDVCHHGGQFFLIHSCCSFPNTRVFTTSG